MSYEVPDSVPIPSDVERPDKILAGLTARQVAIAAVAAAVIWAGFQATRHVMPLPAFAALASPVGLAAAALVIGERDGLPLDRLLMAAWRQRRAPRRLVTAPEGIPAPPAWTAPPGPQPPPPAVLAPLWRHVAPDGVIGLGSAGAAAVAAVSTVNFALRSPDEQDALAAAYGRWLNSLTGPVQILVRAGRADLSAAVAALRDAAPALPHPALEQAALEHAGFLEGLAAERDVLTRQALLIVPRARPRDRPARRHRRRARPAAGRGGRPAAGRRRPPGPGAGRRAGHRPARRLRRPRRAAPAGRADGPARPAGHQRGQARVSPRRPGRAAAPGGPAAPDMPGPPSVEVAARHVRTGDDWSATLAVTGYPAEVSAGWLEPLLSYPGRVDVTLHIEPIPVAVAAARLRRQRARLESGRRAGADRGQLDDPDTEAAADDARDLAYRLARGEGKLFRLGLYLTVHAGSEEDLAAEVQAVRALAASLLLVTVPATFRSLQGWATTLPAGTDQLLLRRTMDTAALAASFPFTSPDLPRDPAAPHALPGVLYGVNTAGPGLVAWDRWAADNHNSVTLAASGAGKSYLAKLEILRSPVRGHRVLGDRPRGRVRPPGRRGRRRVHPPGRAGRAPEPVRPARRRAGQGRTP